MYIDKVMAILSEETNHKWTYEPVKNTKETTSFRLHIDGKPTSVLVIQGGVVNGYQEEKLVRFMAMEKHQARILFEVYPGARISKFKLCRFAKQQAA